MVAEMTPDEVAGAHKDVYEAWYHQIDAHRTNVIGALDAAKFLKKSGLQDNVLGQIWDIADAKCVGQLDKTGFFIALKMIALAQNSKPVDISNARMNVPPPNMGESPPLGPTSSVSNGNTLWTVKPSDKQRYDQIFNSLGPISDRLPGNKVREVLLNSKLPMDLLGRIWDLSDIDKDGCLDRHEFTIAMHLVYRALEKTPVPATLPAELLPPAKRATQLGTMPDLLPASAGGCKPVARPAATAAPQWVVSAADLARYDVMFTTADRDRDGFVSGLEIKDSFLQSGLPQPALAHIWNLCDMKAVGKLNREQFALSQHLISQKLQGVELPTALTPEMVPPTMRPKPGFDAVQPPVEAGPTYENAELEAMHKEIGALLAEQAQLQLDIGQKEELVKQKTTEGSTLQRELETLSATLKQLEGQKGAAAGKLDDLATQTDRLQTDIQSVIEETDRQQLKVDRLQEQVQEQEQNLAAQEQELTEKRRQLTELRDEEQRLEQQVQGNTSRQERLSRTLEDAALQISQATSKVSELQECQRQMSDSLQRCEQALQAGDAADLPDSALQPVQAVFADPHFSEIRSTLSPEPEPEPEPETEKAQPPPRPAAPVSSLNGLGDPFRPMGEGGGSAWGAADPFGGWDAAAASPATAAAAAASDDADPFGAEPFAAAPPPRPPAATTATAAAAAASTATSPTPQLPPKPSGKVPPPRPAPPKAVPARPPPPSFSPKPEPAAASGGFADFANFEQFNSGGDAAWASSAAPAAPVGVDDPFAMHDPFAGAGPDPFSGADPFGGTADPFSGADPFGAGDPFGSADPFGDSGGGGGGGGGTDSGFVTQSSTMEFEAWPPTRPAAASADPFAPLAGSRSQTTSPVAAAVSPALRSASARATPAHVERGASGSPSTVL